MLNSYLIAFLLSIISLSLINLVTDQPTKDGKISNFNVLNPILYNLQITRNYSYEGGHYD
jgi:hypothetical protein